VNGSVWKDPWGQTLADYDAEEAAEKKVRPTPCCRANMAQIRQSRPDYGLVLQVKVLETL